MAWTEQELEDIILDACLKRAGQVYGVNYVRGFLDGQKYSEMKYNNASSESVDGTDY